MVEPCSDRMLMEERVYRGWGTATPAWVTYIRARWLWFQRDETLQPGSVRAHFWPRSVRNRVGSRALRVNASSLKLHRLALCPLANRRGRAGCAVYSEDGTVLLLCSGGKRPDRSSGQESAHLCFRPPPLLCVLVAPAGEEQESSS